MSDAGQSGSAAVARRADASMTNDNVCDCCFMECERSRNRFPCTDDMRKWAREHRDSTGFYFEELSDARCRNPSIQLQPVEGDQ